MNMSKAQQAKKRKSEKGQWHIVNIKWSCFSLQNAVRTQFGHAGSSITCHIYNRIHSGKPFYTFNGKEKQKQVFHIKEIHFFTFNQIRDETK